MTIQKEEYSGSKDWVMAFCSPKGRGQNGCHKDGKTLAWIEHDPHDEPDPITTAEYEAAMAVALFHDEKFPDHIVRVVKYTRS